MKLKYNQDATLMQSIWNVDAIYRVFQKKLYTWHAFNFSGNKHARRLWYISFERWVGLVNLRVSWKKITLRIYRNIPRFGCFKDFSISHETICELEPRIIRNHPSLRMLDIQDSRIFQIKSIFREPRKDCTPRMLDIEDLSMFEVYPRFW